MAIAITAVFPENITDTRRLNLHVDFGNLCMRRHARNLPLRLYLRSSSVVIYVIYIPELPRYKHASARGNDAGEALCALDVQGSAYLFSRANRAWRPVCRPSLGRYCPLVHDVHQRRSSIPPSVLFENPTTGDKLTMPGAATFRRFAEQSQMVGLLFLFENGAKLTLLHEVCFKESHFGFSIYPTQPIPRPCRTHPLLTTIDRGPVLHVGKMTPVYYKSCIWAHRLLPR